MPEYTLGNREISFELLPEGDYEVEVMEIETGLSKKGHEQITMKLAAKPKGVRFTERLTFIESCYGIIDAFVKSTGMYNDEGKPAKIGDSIQFDESTMIGLRGWAHIRPRADDKDPNLKYNSVGWWITNKGYLPRNMTANDWE